jgi:hypothetical protein
MLVGRGRGPSQKSDPLSLRRDGAASEHEPALWKFAFVHSRGACNSPKMGLHLIYASHRSVYVEEVLD